MGTVSGGCTNPVLNIKIVTKVSQIGNLSAPDGADCTVPSFWEGSSSLMEARAGSLESVSKTLSIRPHLFLERAAPLIL